ncbi:MAG: hypothetical protein ACRD4R_12990 [Candidatus Acidiferrales bacterium]
MIAAISPATLYYSFGAAISVITIVSIGLKVVGTLTELKIELVKLSTSFGDFERRVTSLEKQIASLTSAH